MTQVPVLVRQEKVVTCLVNLLALSSWKGPRFTFCPETEASIMKREEKHTGSGSINQDLLKLYCSH